MIYFFIIIIIIFIFFFIIIIITIIIIIIILLFCRFRLALQINCNTSLFISYNSCKFDRH